MISVIIPIQQYYEFCGSVEIRWPNDYDGVEVTIKVKHVSSHDWFGIGFSTGNLMVNKTNVLNMRFDRRSVFMVFYPHIILY